MPILFGLLKVQWCSYTPYTFNFVATKIFRGIGDMDLSKSICLLNYGSVSNWMNLRDADNGKILWQGNEDL